MVKSEADYLSKQVDKARSQLVLDFEAWYAAEYEGRGADVNESMMGGGADVSAEGEVMDDGEKFDRLEVERVMAQVPLPPSLPPPASLSSLPLAGVGGCKSDGKGVLVRMRLLTHAFAAIRKRFLTHGFAAARKLLATGSG